MAFINQVAHLFSHDNKTNTLNKALHQQRRKLYILAFAWCHQASQAEDLVQETFLKALESSKELSNLEHLDAFLVKIMHNCFIDLMRHNQRWHTVDETEIDNFFVQNCCESKLIEDQTSESLCKAMAKLSFEQREAISLADIQGFSYQQIAEIAGIPVGTVMSRISRGRENLIKIMNKVEKGQSKIVSIRR